LLPLIAFLVVAVAVLAVIGFLIHATVTLVAIAAMFLFLTVVIGIWTLGRRRSSL
jgi:hypothetical protein